MDRSNFACKPSQYGALIKAYLCAILGLPLMGILYCLAALFHLLSILSGYLGKLARFTSPLWTRMGRAVAALLSFLRGLKSHLLSSKNSVGSDADFVTSPASQSRTKPGSSLKKLPQGLCRFPSSRLLPDFSHVRSLFSPLGRHFTHLQTNLFPVKARAPKPASMPPLLLDAHEVEEESSLPHLPGADSPRS